MGRGREGVEEGDLNGSKQGNRSHESESSARDGYVKEAGGRKGKEEIYVTIISRMIIEKISSLGCIKSFLRSSFPTGAVSSGQEPLPQSHF